MDKSADLYTRRLANFCQESNFGQILAWVRNVGVTVLGLLALNVSVGLAAPAAGWNGPGFAHFTDFNPSVPVFVNLVKMDRTQEDLELRTTLGNGYTFGVSIVSVQASFIRPEIGQSLAAVNGDYYNHSMQFDGDPMGMQIIAGELISAPNPDRACLYIDAQGNPHITNIIAKFTVTWSNGKTLPIGFNEVRSGGEIVLYTDVVGETTRMRGGTEIILTRNGNDPWLPIKIGQTLKAKVKQLNPNGNSALNTNQIVLSVANGVQIPPTKPGDVITLSTATIPNVAGSTMAIGGGPTLVREGKVRKFEGWQTRHPRTAVGFNSRYFFLLQVDGRQAGHSMGMTFPEMADYFVKLGCTDALNLDGGGSATMWVKGKGVVNRPSQGGERPSANALVVVRKAKK